MKLLRDREVNRREGSAGRGGLSRTRSYEPLEEYTPPLEMETHALSDPGFIVRLLKRILSCRLTYHTEQANVGNSEGANRVEERCLKSF
jgi:hypothetical protein